MVVEVGPNGNGDGGTVVSKSIIAAGLVGIVPALLTLSLEKIGALTLNPVMNALPGEGIVFLLPGMLGAMAVSGNAHAFHLWLAAILNFAFYFLISWAVAVLIGSVLLRFKVSRRATNS